MGDKRTDPGHYYPGGRVRAKSGTAPQELIVQWSDVQGKPQIAPLPDRYKDSDVKGKIDEIASKFATVVVAALIGWTACADVTVQKKRKDEIFNDEMVVVDVTGGGVPSITTNTVRDIAAEVVAPVASSVSDLQSQVSGLASSKLDNNSANGVGVIEWDNDSGWLNIDYLPLNIGWDSSIYIGANTLAWNNWQITAPATVYEGGGFTFQFGNLLKFSDHGGSESTEYETIDDRIVRLAPRYVPTATDQTFSNAVLAVALNVGTNALAQVTNEVAQIAELKKIFDDLPVDPMTGGISIGALLAALASAVAWLRKNKVQTLKLEDDSIVKTAENGVAKLDDFFKESNSLLTSRIGALTKTNAESAAEPTNAVTLNDDAPMTVTVATVESPATPSLAVTFANARQTGGLRLCELYILNGTADTDLTFDSAVQFVGGSNTFPACEAGINYYVFAEIAANLWKVSRETLNSITTPVAAA